MRAILASGPSGVSATARASTSMTDPAGLSPANSIAPAPETSTGSKVTCTGSRSDVDSGPMPRCTTVPCGNAGMPAGSTPTVIGPETVGRITSWALTRTMCWPGSAAMYSAAPPTCPAIEMANGSLGISTRGVRAPNR